jgi:type III secretion protein L
MAFLIPKPRSEEQPDSRNKIIRSQDYWAYLEAKQIIADAVTRKSEIILDAKNSFVEEKKRGYRDGLEEAKLEQSANMIEIIGKTVDYFARVEAQMVDLVMDAVRRIMSDYDNRERVIQVVKQSLAMVRSQKNISIRIHTENYEMMSSTISELKDMYKNIEQIEIISDHLIPVDACIIESDIGKVEASMSGQIEALKRSFAQVFGESSDKKEMHSSQNEIKDLRNDISETVTTDL